MAKLLSTCKHCGKEFEHWKYKNRSFCSKLCSNKFNNPVKSKLKSICKCCNKEFEHWRLKNRTPNYCSRACYKDYFFKQHTHQCKSCLKSFFNNRKTGAFCSKKCVYKNLPQTQSFWNRATKKEKMKRWHIKFEKFVIRQEGCWDWSGVKDKDGYPQMQQSMRAHRFSYMYYKGEIPKGMFVCHSCDFP